MAAGRQSADSGSNGAVTERAAQFDADEVIGQDVQALLGRWVDGARSGPGPRDRVPLRQAL